LPYGRPTGRKPSSSGAPPCFRHTRRLLRQRRLMRQRRLLRQRWADDGGQSCMQASARWR
jgi:hypothetical protein